MATLTRKEMVREEQKRLNQLTKKRLYIAVTKTQLFFCNGVELSTIYAKNRNVKMLKYRTYAQAKKMYEKLKGKNVEEVYEKIAKTPRVFKIKNKTTREVFYYLGENVWNRYNRNWFYVKEIKQKRTEETNRNKNNRKQVESNRRKRKPKQKEKLGIIIYSKDGELKTASTFDVSAKISAEIKDSPIKGVIQFENAEKMKKESKKTPLETYKRVLRERFYKGNKGVVLIKGTEAMVVKNSEELALETTYGKEKDDYSIHSFPHIDMAERFAKQTEERVQEDSFYSDASVKGTNAQYRIVGKGFKEIYRSEVYQAKKGTGMSWLFELLGLYKAVKMMEEAGKHESKIYTDCEVVEEAFRSSAKKEMLKEKIKNELEKTKDKEELVVLMEALEALDYLFEAKANVLLWVQKEMGTNPAHFKVK